MILTRTIVASVLALGVVTSAGGVLAQEAVRPSELPPVTFRGNQFADSTGCVFTRIGVDDAVRWAPRVDRNRQQICGRTPTFDPAEAVAPRTEPAIVPEGEEVVIVVPRLPSADSEIAVVPSAGAPDASVPAVTTRTTADAAPVAPVAAPAAARAAPKAPAPRKKPAAPKPQPAQTSSAGPDLAGVVVTAETAQNLGVGGTVRVLPRHVFEERRDFKPVRVPKGYRKAWNDGRMNPRRAEQTLQGHQRMQEIWTRTTPMRLVER
ncbi:hypothetical protein [uncultured Roseobacter sp.]|uniref:hypothetical protein n=1 Tax=uncultured Roseobacter sp. TaxID=114847 RepID=UPI0026246097|nr:hypothetical protein [uncultured Roseobacter sp.]